MQATTAQHTAISIHALREEGDGTAENGLSERKHFYPRPPRGGRQYARHNILRAKNISIHALREEGDYFPAVELLSL